MKVIDIIDVYKQSGKSSAIKYVQESISSNKTHAVDPKAVHKSVGRLIDKYVKLNKNKSQPKVKAELDEFLGGMHKAPDVTLVRLQVKKHPPQTNDFDELVYKNVAEQISRELKVPTLTPLSHLIKTQILL